MSEYPWCEACSYPADQCECKGPAVSFIAITPSTGAQTPVTLNLNRLRLKPGDRVVYWSPAAQAVKIDVIDAYASDDGNYFSINGERLIVSSLWARTPDDCSVEQEDAIIADFAAFGRSTITAWERMSVCDRHGLTS